MIKCGTFLGTWSVDLAAFLTLQGHYFVDQRDLGQSPKPFMFPTSPQLQAAVRSYRSRKGKVIARDFTDQVQRLRSYFYQWLRRSKKRNRKAHKNDIGKLADS